MAELTQDYLKSILNYDQDTGIFIWKVNKSKNIKIGSIAGSKQKYIRIAIDSKSYKAHRLAWLYVFGKFPKDQIDHINTDKHDNRLLNLREANGSENHQNQIKAIISNKSGLIGVNTDREKYFRAIIGINGKRINLGSFKTKEEAHEAYIKAKRELHPFGML